MSVFNSERIENETPFGFSFYPETKTNDPNTPNKETKDFRYSPITPKMQNDTSHSNSLKIDCGKSDDNQINWGVTPIRIPGKTPLKSRYSKLAGIGY